MLSEADDSSSEASAVRQATGCTQTGVQQSGDSFYASRLSLTITTTTNPEYKRLEKE